MENAEDDLVQKTEVAITLMKTVLDNVRYISLRLFPGFRICSDYQSRPPLGYVRERSD